jgi:hypothetical protein
LLDIPVDLIADHNDLIADIRAEVTEAPAVIAIDTLNRSIAGDENRSDDMAKYIKAADALRRAFNCLILIIHHCGVAGSRPRGHTSLAGADDCQIAVEKDKDGVVTATVEHAKDFEAGAVFTSKLERVELGIVADDGEKLSSCVVVPTISAKGLKLSKVNALAFNVLAKLIEAEGSKPPAEANLHPSVRVCLTATWRDQFYAAHPADKQGTKQKAFVRAHIDLIEAKLVGFWDQYVWLAADEPDHPDKPDKSRF